MASPASLSDAELRAELLTFGVNVGPITVTTRAVYEKQLGRRRLEGKSTTAATRLPPKRNSSKSPGRTPAKDTSSPKRSVIAKKTSTPRQEFENESESDFNLSNVFTNEERGGIKTRSTNKPPPAARNLSPIKRVANESTSVIYPGLTNKNSPVVDTAFKQKIQSKPLTPPRTTFVRRPITSQVPTSSFVSSLSSYQNSMKRDADRDRSRYRPDPDEEEQSEDDHMESSRTFQNYRSHLAPKPRVPVSPRQSWTAWWNSIFGARRTAQAIPARSHYVDSRSRARILQSTWSTPSGSDVSRLLVISLSVLFGFLLLAYLATVHTGFFIHIGRMTYGATRDTAIFLYTYAILPTLIVTIVLAAVGAIYLLRQYRMRKQKEEKQLIFGLVEKIIDIIRDANENGHVYVAEPHVRDMLIPPSKRLRDSPEWHRWQEAVSFLNLNESRVSTETRIINGVECAVWRWVPAKKSGWQGNGS